MPVYVRVSETTYHEVLNCYGRFQERDYLCKHCAVRIPCSYNEPTFYLERRLGGCPLRRECIQYQRHRNHFPQFSAQICNGHDFAQCRWYRRRNGRKPHHPHHATIRSLIRRVRELEGTQKAEQVAVGGGV